MKNSARKEEEGGRELILPVNSFKNSRDTSQGTDTQI